MTTSMVRELWPRQGDAFHPTRLDELRSIATPTAIAALRACRADVDGVVCGYCHNCGAELPTPDGGACPACGSSDEDE